MNKKTTLFFITSLFLIINIAQAFAGNIYTFNMYETATSTPLTNITGLYYQCSVEGCADNTEPYKFSTKNSGVTNTISQEYLGTPNPQDYLTVLLKQCYLPKSVLVSDDWGTGQSYNYNWVMKKADSCHSPIYSYSILNSVEINKPLQINVQAILDATTSSAFRRTGFPPLFNPAGYETYFGADTEITLEIYNSANTLINTQAQSFNIMVDQTQDVNFTWTPTTAGDYTARITTQVTDCQCASNTEEYVNAAFTVNPAAPPAQCYTLVNNLESNNTFPMLGESLTFYVDKTSNYANGAVLTSVPTDFFWNITNLNTSVSQTFITSANANPNTLTPQIINLTWTPNAPGQYLVSVTGISNDALCSGIENLAMTTQMTLTVLPQPPSCTDIDGDGYSQEGGVCGAQDCADTNINIHPSAQELCNSIDDNCDSNIDEVFLGLGGSCSAGVGACLQTGTLVCSANGLSTQCSATPLLPTQETCDNIDNDCDGSTDENLNQLAGDLGICQANTQTCNAGLWIDNNETLPQNEICNNLDDDCDGQVDEGNVCIPVINCTDVDSDGFSMEGGICGAVDCNDNNDMINPNATESCNGLDDNCDFNIDEIFTNLGQSCSAGTGACSSIGTYVCSLNGLTTYCNAVIGNATTEVCNGIDDDCDGQVDEGNVCQPQFCIDDDGGINFSIRGTTQVPGANHTDYCVQYQGINTGELIEFYCASPTSSDSSIVYTCPYGCFDGACLQAPICTDNDNDTYSAQGGACGIQDCNDNDMLINPAATEVCDGIDNNCDGQVDENNACVDVPVAFTISALPTSGVQPLQVFFTSNIISGNAPFTYLWNFSDGHTSTGANPTHIFYGEDIFKVSLTVTDFDGDSATQYISIDTTQDHELYSREAIYVADVVVVGGEYNIKQGSTITIETSFTNQAGRKIEDVTITASIVEFGISSNAKAGTMSNGETVNKRFYMDIPSNIPKGYYYLRMTYTANSGQVKRVVYREIRIV